MTTKIEKDGWSISGDSLEELALGVAAVQHALRRSANGAETPLKRVGRPPSRDLDGGRRAKRAEMAQGAAKFLAAIRDAGEAGVLGADLVPVLGLSTPKALGIIVGNMHRLTDEAGLRRQSVYRNDRSSKGRTWIPGPKINDAIAALEKIAKSD